MNNLILVAGGTGDLGSRIIKALVKRNADVVAVVRHNSDKEKVAALGDIGVKVVHVDMNNVADLTEACKNVTCVVSALAGLGETIIDAQSLLLDAAIAAKVPRFIPSDFSSDFTQIAEGENRNFDLRKAFHKKLDNSPIAATAIMNGAFADILFYNTPFYNVKGKSVGYWGNDAAFKVDFTTKDDVANFTAAAALDENTPSILRIASFQVSANDLIGITKELKGIDFKLIPIGSLEELSANNKKPGRKIRQGSRSFIQNGKAANTCTVCFLHKIIHWIIAVTQILLGQTYKMCWRTLNCKHIYRYVFGTKNTNL